MKLFIGLDVSLAKTAVCVINEHGKIAKEAQVRGPNRDAVPMMPWSGLSPAYAEHANETGTSESSHWTSIMWQPSR